jgi:hypothetical protein
MKFQVWAALPSGCTCGPLLCSTLHNYLSDWYDFCKTNFLFATKAFLLIPTWQCELMPVGVMVYRCYAALHQLCSIHLAHVSIFTSFVNAQVLICHLDDGTGRLQLVHNAMVQRILQLYHSDCIIDVVAYHVWLSVPKQSTNKTAVPAYQALSKVTSHHSRQLVRINDVSFQQSLQLSDRSCCKV